MKNINSLTCILPLLFFMNTSLHADDTLELQTTIIKGNKEVPQILYIVPWQDTKNSSAKEEQKLILHSLFGDLFDPVLPGKIDHTVKTDE